MSVRPVERTSERGEFEHDPKVPGDVLTPDPALWAARALDGELWGFAHAEARADRELARGLAALWERELHRPLGYVRAIDFVREHLGIQERRARWLARLGRVLAVSPELDQAFVAGRLSASHVLELAAVVSAETSLEERARWIEAAAGLSFRALQRLVRKAKRERVGEEVETAPAASEAPNEDEAASEGMDPAPDGGWMTIPVPARVGVLWHDSVAVARAASGEHLTQGQAAELIFAEYVSGPGGAPATIANESHDAARERLLAEVMAAMNATARKPKHQGPDPLEKPEPKAARFPRVDWQVPPAALPPDCVVDPEAEAWVFATTLIRLCEHKKHLRTALAARLARLQGARPWATLGFPAFTLYCEERLGFGLRRAERLIRFHHGLERFPRVRAAYLAGGLSYTAALLLLPLLHENTETLWVQWAVGLTYREIERVAEYARLFALPEADASVLASWIDGLVATGFAQRKDATAADGRADATVFATEEPPRNAVPEGVPPGYPLPPSAPRALPTITGFPADLSLLPPERCLATIRFFLPQDALDLAGTALHRCRQAEPDPLRPTWVYLEILLHHFLHTHNAPEIRARHRAHPVLCRDGFLCTIPGCGCHGHLEDHHLLFLSRGGSDYLTNRTSTCAGHHRPAIHRGTIDFGGFAPDQLIARLGIHPRTGQAFAAYLGERRVSEETARAALAAWRRACRHRAGTSSRAGANHD